MDEVESVSHDDERQLFCEALLFEEVEDFGGVICIRLAADALHLLQLTHLGGCLDVFEGDILVFGEIDDAAEIEVEAFGRAVLLEEIDDAIWAEKVRVLLGDIYHILEVAANVHLQHLIETLQAELDRQLAKVVDEEVFWNLVGLNCGEVELAHASVM